MMCRIYLLSHSRPLSFDHDQLDTFVHQAFCVQGVSGLTYIFSTTMVIAIFSMVMIMFRAAMYPIKEPSDDLKLESEDEVAHPPPADDDAAAEEEGEEKPVIY